MTGDYVHGYDDPELRRLADQAQTLEELLHAGTAYPRGAQVLEAGCGVGAQTVALVRNSPEAHFTCVDLSSVSLARAAASVGGSANVRFLQADLLRLPFPDASFDHVFICFVLEHLKNPALALAELRRVLRPDGSLTVIEGDHGSAIFSPTSAAAEAAIACQVALQSASGGDANVGRRLFPLVAGAGFADVHVAPRIVYVDETKPNLVEGFIRNTFTAMIAGVRDQAIASGLTTASAFDTGVAALLRTAEPGGVFCYTFFKATARKS